MLNRTFALSFSALAASAAAFAQSDAVTPLQFVAQAASSGQFEIESSRLALQRVPEGPLAEFARHMIDDHARAAERLAAAASAAGVTPPPGMTEAHRARLDALAATAGADFDAAYVTAQAAAHQEAVALFTAFAALDPDSALAAFALETLPVLQEHERGISALAAR